MGMILEMVVVPDIEREIQVLMAFIKMEIEGSHWGMSDIEC